MQMFVKKQREIYYNSLLGNRLDFEVQRNNRDYKTLQILNQIIERTEALGVLTILNGHHCTDRRALPVSPYSKLYQKENMLIIQNNLQFLTTLCRRLWPIRIIFLHNLALLHNSPHLIHNSFRHLH